MLAVTRVAASRRYHKALSYLLAGSTMKPIVHLVSPRERRVAERVLSRATCPVLSRDSASTVVARSTVPSPLKMTLDQCFDEHDPLAFFLRVVHLRKLRPIDVEERIGRRKIL